MKSGMLIHMTDLPPMLERARARALKHLTPRQKVLEQDYEGLEQMAPIASANVAPMRLIPSGVSGSMEPSEAVSIEEWAALNEIENIPDEEIYTGNLENILRNAELADNFKMREIISNPEMTGAGGDYEGIDENTALQSWEKKRNIMRQKLMDIME